MLMVIDHGMYDLAAYSDIAAEVYGLQLLVWMRWLFACVFVLISGACSEMSHNNFRRSLRLSAAALLVTLVTSAVGMPVKFGVLHLLAAGTFAYALLHRILARFSPAQQITVFSAAAVLSQAAVMLIHFNVRFMWVFGWRYPGFVSYDYFPVFPWLFIFIAGGGTGRLAAAGKLPKLFYDFRLPAAEWVGRHAMTVYLLHQPVLYAASMLTAVCMKTVT